MKPKQLATSNILRIDDIARRVSGLNVADGQANIRAGSGWSYGVGSRNDGFGWLTFIVSRSW